MKGQKIYLYRLPELIEDIAQDREIFLVEGEKDVDNLRKLGIPATTSPMGAGTWWDEFNKYFENAKIVIIPDNDEPGQKHAELIISNLINIAFSIKLIKLDVKEKGDVSDWLEARHTITELYTIVTNTPTYSKSKEIEQKIRNENDERIFQNEIENIRNYIYSDDDKPKILHDNVIQVLLEKYKICVTITNNRKRYFIYEDGYWKEIRKEFIASIIFQWLKSKDRTAIIAEKITDALFMYKNIFIDENKFNAKVNKVNLQNCTYNFETFEPEPHNPDDYFTYKTNYAYIENAQCPFFLKFLYDYSLGNNEWIQAFFEIAGYAMTGTFDIQKMFWFTGSKGRNGKGTCIRVIENLVGDTFTISDIDTREFREKFYKNRFRGKRLATTGDLHNRLANVATLKQLTGGDKQTTDIKFGYPVTFTNTAKIIFAMNQLPMLPPDENITPIAKRILILPFEYEIKKTDATVENKITNELPGIFNLAVEGLKRLRKKREFTFVERGDLLLQMYQKNVPVFEQFVIDNIEYEKDSNKGLFIYEIWELYQKFMNEIYGGEHWKHDKEQTVKNSWDLGYHIRQFYLFRGIQIESKRKYSSEKGGSFSYIENIFFTNNNIVTYWYIMTFYFRKVLGKFLKIPK